MAKRTALLCALLLLFSMALLGSTSFAWNGQAAPQAKFVEADLKNAEISLNESQKTIKKGATFSLKSLITPKVAGKYVKYQSSNTSIAKVTQAGKVKGVGYGDVVITASYGDDIAVCNVTVTGPLKKVTLNAKTANCQVGQTVELRIASVDPSNADISSVSWSSNKPAVASVSNGIVTAVGVGKATITCKIGSKSVTCTVDVSAPAGSSSGGDLSDQIDSNASSASSMEAQILKLVNQERQKAGLKKLSYYSPLEGYARTRSQEIVKSFAHTRPNGSSCFSVIKYGYTWGGENIAMGFEAPEDVMNGWMNSPGHRANILNANFTEMGVGIYRGNNCLYWVQLFTKKK